MTPNQIDRISALRERLTDTMRGLHHDATEAIDDARRAVALKLRETASLLCDDTVIMNRAAFEDWRGSVRDACDLIDEIRDAADTPVGSVIDEIRRLKDIVREFAKARKWHTSTDEIDPVRGTLAH